MTEKREDTCFDVRSGGGDENRASLCECSKLRFSHSVAFFYITRFESCAVASPPEEKLIKETMLYVIYIYIVLLSLKQNWSNASPFG